MKRRLILSLLFGLTTALLLSTVIATIATFVDWRENPSGIFQDETGTRWNIVRETFSSWFWPIAVTVLPIATAIRYPFTKKRIHS